MSGFNQYLGLDEDFDEVNCTMYTNRLGEFKNYANTRICIYSKNDPYVKLQALQDFAKAIDAKEIVYDKAGHFNASAGYTKFEDILKLL